MLIAYWGMIFTFIGSVAGPWSSEPLLTPPTAIPAHPPQHILTCVDLVVLGRVAAVLVVVWPGRGEAGGQQTGDQGRHHQHPRTLLQPRLGDNTGRSSVPLCPY